MIAFDTNYVVRHLVEDDPEQCAQVAAIIRRESERSRPILLLDIVLCETVWVLESVYGATREDLLTALQSLRSEAAFSFEVTARVDAAIERFANSKTDFSDCLILETVRENDCELRTFDQRLQRQLC